MGGASCGVLVCTSLIADGAWHSGGSDDISILARMSEALHSSVRYTRWYYTASLQVQEVGIG